MGKGKNKKSKKQGKVNQSPPATNQNESKKGRKNKKGGNKNDEKAVRSLATTEVLDVQKDHFATTSQERGKQLQSDSTGRENSDQQEHPTKIQQQQQKQQQQAGASGYQKNNQKHQFPRNKWHQGPEGQKKSHKVTFYLYLENASVQQAFIQFNGFPNPQPLSLVSFSERQIQVWWYTANFDHAIQSSRVLYRYVLLYEGSNRFCDGKRRIFAPMQLDIIHFNDGNKKKTTAIRAVLFFVDWLLPLVNRETVEDFLFSIKALQFRFFDSAAMEKCLQWIKGTAADTLITSVQRYYLCVILGHLATHARICHMPLPVDHGGTAKNAFDRLLVSLVSSDPHIRHNMDFKTLENMAHVLVEHSSYPGWLTFAAHFCRYLGVKCVGQARTRREGIYDKPNYCRLLDLLFAGLRIIHPSEFRNYKQLLGRLLVLAPDLDSVVEAYLEANKRFSFKSDANKSQFFDTFYLDDNLQSVRERSTSFRKNLADVMKIPQQLLHKMPGLVYTPLLEFTQSEVEPEQNEVGTFLQLIGLVQLHKQQLYSILINISASKSASLMSLLPQVLNQDEIQSTWKQIPRTQKVKICLSWVITRITNGARQQESAKKTTLAYQGVDKLMSCSSNAANNELGYDLCNQVSEWLFKNEDHFCIFEAFGDIERFALRIQEWYQYLVKAILKRKLGLVNTNELLSQWLHSR